MIMKANQTIPVVYWGQFCLSEGLLSSIGLKNGLFIARLSDVLEHP